MSRKSKIRRIKWGIFIALICISSALTFKIYAQTGSDTASAEQTTCTHHTCNRENIISIYNPTITDTYNEATMQDIITIQTNKTTQAAKFYYVIADIGETGYVILKDGYIDNVNNKIDYPVSTTRSSNIEVILTLVEAAECATTSDFEIYPIANIQAAITEYLQTLDEEMPKVAKIDDEKCRYALFATSFIQIDYEADTTEENESLKAGGLCHSFRNGLCNNFSSIDGVDSATAANLKSKCEKYNPTVASLTVPSGYANLNAYYASALEYCYSNAVDVNYSNKTIATMINNATLSYIADTSEYSSVPLTAPDPTSVNHSNPSNKITLTCDKDKVSDTFANTDTTYQYTNINKYHHTNTKTETQTSSTGNTYTCEKTCQEEITVQYGPPVAVKAGLCFEYQVKVESKVNCTSKFTGTKPQKSNYNYCTPTPICNNSSKFFDQAGPNEDFDACINECDGGKYSQKCINKCYKDIYESGNGSLNVNYTNQVNASQISNSMITTKVRYTNDADIKKLMEAINNNDNCYYTKNVHDEIIWKCDTTAQGWEKYGRYYFKSLNKAKKTIDHDYNVGIGETRVYLGRSKIWKYQGVDGYKKACQNSNCSSYCDDKCKWTGCSSAKYLNPKEAMDDYNADIEAYNTAKSSCTTSVSCNTSTATFKIKVDNEGSSMTPGEFVATVASTNKNWTDTNNIIIDRGQCYKDGDTNTKQYMTEWGVPGTYINNKTGAISYDTKNTSAGWTYKQNQFCTSLDTKNVNEDWWDWRVEKQAGAAPSPTKYNVVAKTKDFGYFDWNFEIKCFYASSEGGTPPPGGDEGDKALSYRVRSVDNANLFPDPESTNTTLPDAASTGRTPGFNWSYEGTDKRNSDYEITPMTLMKEIQTLGTNIYSGDSYVDYEFILDTETLKKVANYKSNHNSFTAGESEEKFGITFYKSKLIRNIIPAANRKLPSVSSFGCNNKATTGGCQTFS